MTDPGADGMLFQVTDEMDWTRFVRAEATARGVRLTIGTESADVVRESIPEVVAGLVRLAFGVPFPHERER